MDAATGRKRWIRPRSPRSYEQFTSPVVADGRIYVSVPYESLSAVDAATGSKLWEMKNYASPHASAVVADGTLPGLTDRFRMSSVRLGSSCAFSPAWARCPSWRAVWHCSAVNNDTRKYATRSLAVWEGDRPPSDRAAGQTFEELYDHFVRRSDRQEDRGLYEPPTDRIAAYMAALLERWPNPTGDEDDHPVWNDGLVGSETGPLIYFGVRWNMAEEVTAFAVQVATSMELVCFDVSRGKLLS